MAVQNSSKKKLILDWRYVNKHICKERIKFDDLKLNEQFLNPRGYLFKFDIKQSYHHIYIYKPYQKFLSFSLEVRGKDCCFVFTVLPLELTIRAPTVYIYKGYMKSLVKHWRINVIRIACFLDDSLGGASSYKKTLFHSNFVRKSFQNAGFIISIRNSF